MQIIAIVKKEFQLIARDPHGLFLLFLMPAIFILIMSLALKSGFDERSTTQIDVLLMPSHDATTNDIANAIRLNKHFNLVTLQEFSESLERPATREEAIEAIRRDRYMFLIYPIESDDEFEDIIEIELFVAPKADPLLTELFISLLKKEVHTKSIKENIQLLANTTPGLNADQLKSAFEVDLKRFIEIKYSHNDATGIKPTSVQQNVPAWLIFGMFFITIPLSTTFIQERISGTTYRIKTFPVTYWKLIAGKLIPYFCINQLQMIAMLAIGVYAIPLLGGDQLTLGNSIVGLMFISSAVSIAALGLALFVASIAGTTEQATTLGGACNIILAAIGGIMIPKFIMPEFMQEISILSPMAWGLEGFLDILLRSGTIIDVIAEASALIGLGLTLLIITSFTQKRHWPAGR